MNPFLAGVIAFTLIGVCATAVSAAGGLAFLAIGGGYAYLVLTERSEHDECPPPLDERVCERASTLEPGDDSIDAPAVFRWRHYVASRPVEERGR